MTTDRRIRLHRRQYVVGPRAISPADGWIHKRLDDGHWLSHCPDLNVAPVGDGYGRRWYLLGLASQTRPDRADPIDELAALPATPTAPGPPIASPSSTAADAVVRTTENWVGRWTLIGGGEIHPDATAQLPCHWAVDDEGETWASSSPALLRSRFPRRRPQHRDLVYERGMSWVVPPIGTFAGARRLLPSQILNVGDGTTRWRRLVVPARELAAEDIGSGGDDRPGRSDPAMIRFLDAIGTGMQRLPADKPKLLSLTAGADSRLVLATAVRAGIPVTVFTRRAARMSLADRRIPPQLAAAVGLDHREVLPRPANSARDTLAQAHTDGHVSPGDALPFVEGVRDGLVGIEIGGQGFGAGKVKNRRFPATIGNPTAMATLVADDLGEPPDSPNRLALAHWFRAVVEHEHTQPPDDRIDWRDRFYLEQRTAGWQAAKEQLYDLQSHQRFFPINSARVFGLLLAIDPALRSDGSHRRALIALADQRLLHHPFNPPGDHFGMAARVRHLLTVDRSGAAKRALDHVAGRAASAHRADRAEPTARGHRAVSDR